MKLSARVRGLTLSSTFAVSNRVAEMRREGIDVIGFGLGEPDFDTPDHIKRAAIEAILAGQTKYARPPSGIPAARAAIREKFRRDNGLTYADDQVMTTVGAKEGLSLAMRAVLDPGDEAIIPLPYWVSYPTMVETTGATPVFVPTRPEDHFRMSPEVLAAKISPRTRLLVLNYPNNPAGSTYTESALREIAAVISGRDIVVVCDELYDRLLFAGRRHVSFASLSEETYANTVTVNAASKAYAMTGWRAGFAGGPAEIITAMSRLQTQTTTGVATFTQIALAAALDGPQDCVRQMREQFEQRAQVMHAGLVRLRGVSCQAPEGGFFMFPHVAENYERLGVADSHGFVRRLLEEAHVATIPGASFGCDEHVRFSCACSMENIHEGLRRLERLLGTR